VVDTADMAPDPDGHPPPGALDTTVLSNILVEVALKVAR
jgi:hypothetical protein